MIAVFVLPCTLSLLIMYLYPVSTTIVMSFFAIDSVTASVSEWSFNGLGNYARIFGSATYLTSLSNMVKIWFVGGILTLTIALLFAVILTSGIRDQSRCAGAHGDSVCVYSGLRSPERHAGDGRTGRREMAGNGYEVLGDAVCLRSRRGWLLYAHFHQRN